MAVTQIVRNRAQGRGRSLWSRRNSGLYTPRHSLFPLDGLELYAPLWFPDCGSIDNGTGIASSVPQALKPPAATTITVTQAGTFVIHLPAGVTGTVASGTATITGSPVALTGGNNTVTAEGTGTFTVTIASLVSKDLNAHVMTVTGVVLGADGGTFEGSVDLISLGNPSALNFTGSFSIVIWIEVDDATATGGFISKWVANDQAYVLIVVGSKSAIYVTNTAAAWDANRASSANLVNNTWVQVAAVYTSGGTPTLNMYLNGALDNGTLTGTVPASVRVSAANVILGRNGASQNMNGTIGEVLVYNRALTAAEVLHIYNSTKWRYR